MTSYTAPAAPSWCVPRGNLFPEASREICFPTTFPPLVNVNQVTLPTPSRGNLFPGRHREICFPTPPPSPTLMSMSTKVHLWQYVTFIHLVSGSEYQDLIYDARDLEESAYAEDTSKKYQSNYHSFQNFRRKFNKHKKPRKDLGHFWLDYIRMLGHLEMSAHLRNFERL